MSHLPMTAVPEFKRLSLRRVRSLKVHQDLINFDGISIQFDVNITDGQSKGYLIPVSWLVLSHSFTTVSPGISCDHCVICVPSFQK